MMNTTIDLEYVTEIQGERLPYFQATAARILSTAKGVALFGGRKAPLSLVAEALGMPLSRLASLLVHLQCAGLVQLVRADMGGNAYGALESAVLASHVHSAGSDFHFLVVG